MIARAVLLPTFIEMLAGCCIVNEVPGSADFLLRIHFLADDSWSQSDVKVSSFKENCCWSQGLLHGAKPLTAYYVREIHLFDHRQALTLEQQSLP